MPPALTPEHGGGAASVAAGKGRGGGERRRKRQKAGIRNLGGRALTLRKEESDWLQQVLGETIVL